MACLWPPTLKCLDGFNEYMKIAVPSETQSEENRAAASPDSVKAFVKKGLKAGELVKKAAECCDGGGGGRPALAQAGGKDPSGLSEALKAVKLILESA